MEQMQEYRPRRRRRKKQSILTAAPLLICVIAFGVVYLLTGCFGLNKGTDNRPADQPTTPAIETEAPAETAAPAATETAAPSETEAPATETGEESTETSETESTEAPTEAPTEAASGKPEFTTVGEGYFDDALFVGDSRTNGLEIYDPPSYGADFYCGTSMTIFGVLDSTESVHGTTGFANVLQAKDYGKVYLMFGINECGYDTEMFVDSYREVVETVRKYQPNAIIYIQSILYVTQSKENAMPVFASEKLKEKNRAIAELANDRDIFYLEVNDALNDGTDHLPEDYTGDGVHLKASNYKYWKEYLYEHAIVDASHPAEAAPVDIIDD